MILMIMLVSGTFVHIKGNNNDFKVIALKGGSSIDHLSFKYLTHTIPSLQGTLAKRTKPMLQPNFAKEPFRPSRSNARLRDCGNLINKLIEDKNLQCLTWYIFHWRGLGLLNFCTFIKYNVT